MATVRERLAQMRQKTVQDRLAEMRVKRSTPQDENFDRPSPEWGADLVTRGAEPTGIQKSLGGAALGYGGGLLKGIGAIAQTLTGGRIGGTPARAGQYVTEKGSEAAPVSEFIGELAAPVAFGKKASQLLKVGEKGISAIKKAARAAGVGAITVPAAVPVLAPEDQSVADFYTEKGGQALMGAIGGAALSGVVSAGGTAFNRLRDIIGNKTIKEARDIIQRYRVKTLGDLEKAVRQEEESAAKVRGQREQIVAGQTTREARAEQRATTGAPAREKQKVLETARERERSAQQSLLDAERRSVAANDAISDLETRLGQDPQAERANFGTFIRNIARKIQTTGESNRKQVADFSKMIEAAPPDPIISVAGLQTAIRKELKDINYPFLEKLFTDLEQRLGGPEARLSVRAADSLKVYLNDILETRSVDGKPIGKDVYAKILPLKNELIASLKKGYEPYRVAYEAYGPASRPLDIVERNGALKKVVDIDPMTSQFKLTESEVVGAVIAKAEKGNPVFQRLLSENPDLQEPARLYFTRDLLGRGSPPTPQQFKTWLKNNQNSLQQLGLYDEFATLAAARKTADRVVKVAKGVEAEAAAFRKAAARYVEKAAAAPVSKEKLVAETTKTAGQRATELQRVEEATVKRVEALRRLQARLSAVKDESVPVEAAKLIENMRSSKLINDRQYEQLIGQLGEIEATVEKSQQAQKIRNWFYAGLTTSLVGGGIAGVLLRPSPNSPAGANE